MGKRRETVFQEQCLEDIRYWVSKDRKIALHICRMIDDIRRNPLNGSGKHERLKFVSDTYARRITHEDRLVYLVRDSRIDFLQARGHYGRDMALSHFDEKFCSSGKRCDLRNPRCPRMQKSSL